MAPKFRALAITVTLLALSTALSQRAVAAPTVIASIAPLHSLVAAVMQGVAAPRLLLRGGESPHTFSLRPSDARLLHQADVLFWIGPALELPLARILPNLGVQRSVAMLEVPGLTLLPVRHLDAQDDAGHAEAVDPHVWLSPTNAMIMADEIARVLAMVDVPRAALYRSNAARLKQRLQALDRDLALQLANTGGAYAVFHDAYQYFERHYSLQSAATVTTHAERSPGAAHLHRLRAQLASSDVHCLFSEPQFQPRLVAMLSEGLPIRHAVLDPLGAGIPPGPDAYPQLMHDIADRIGTCLHGGTRP